MSGGTDSFLLLLVQHDYVNAGVMLVRPDAKVFKDMMQFFATTKPKKLFGNLIDCTEMGLINSFFGKPHRLTPSKTTGKLELDAKSNSAPEAQTAILPVLVDSKYVIGRPDLLRDYSKSCPWAVHFMRKDHCAKPWDVCQKNGRVGKLGNNCDSFPYHIWCRLAKRDRG